MKHTKKIVLLGVLVAIVPFLGFPTAWKTGIFAVLGLTIAALGYRMSAEAHSLKSHESDSYAQSAIHGVGPAIAHE